jgi:hypothetical protein
LLSVNYFSLVVSMPPSVSLPFFVLFFYVPLFIHFILSTAFWMEIEALQNFYTHRIYRHTHQAGFEPTKPVFELSNWFRSTVIRTDELKLILIANWRFPQIWDSEQQTEDYGGVVKSRGHMIGHLTLRLRQTRSVLRSGVPRFFFKFFHCYFVSLAVIHIHLLLIEMCVYIAYSPNQHKKA